jgi:hypothetical protein
VDFLLFYNSVEKEIKVVLPVKSKNNLVTA